MASQHANAAVRHEVEAGGSPSAESLAGAEQAATAYQAALGRMDEALAHAGLVSAQLTHPEGAEDGATGTSAADPAGDSFAASAPVAPPQGTEAAAGGVDTGDDFAQPAPAVGDGEAAPADMVISLQEATAQRQTEAGDVFSQPAPQGPADQEAPAAAAVLTPAGAPDAGSDVGSSGH